MEVLRKITQGTPTKVPLRQGAHPDPLDADRPPPTLSDWQRQYLTGAAMEAFVTGMGNGDHDIRATILRELSDYWRRDPDETLDRCINWEDYSVREWQRQDRTTADGVLDFYQQCESWTYDLLWYDYLRTCEYAIPHAVVIAEWLRTRCRPGSHLDFGAGTGSASIMFHHLGWRSTIGDVSMPLLDFARWRVDQRGLPIDSLDLRQPLPNAAFDVVTAIDTFAHVPDVFPVASSLHAAMRPDGYLFANFDVRPPSEYNAWHLYSDDLALHWDIRRAGFRHVGAIPEIGMHIFRWAPSSSVGYRARLGVDALRYGPPSKAYWQTRHATGSLVRRALSHR